MVQWVAGGRKNAHAAKRFKAAVVKYLIEPDNNYI